MFEVYFEDKWYKRELIATCETEEEAGREFAKHLCNRFPEVKRYYTRYWKNEAGEIVIDFGSHSEFGIVKPLTFF